MAHHEEFHHTYGFRFSDTEYLAGFPSHPVAQVWAVGWENITHHDYDWDGAKRTDQGIYVIQYTLAGAGAIEVDGHVHMLNPMSAFIVYIPSAHRYYLPSKSHDWEFMWIMLYGDAVDRHLHTIINEYSSVIEFQPDSSAVRLLRQIHSLAANRAITDSYQGSAIAYQLLMEISRTLGQSQRDPEKWPIAINQALRFLHDHFSEPITLDDVADAVSLSKYHFGVCFHSAIGISPMRYLTKIRLEKAISPLLQSNRTIEQIARDVGFANGNYFCKVFRRAIGVSPGEFRQGKTYAAVGDIKLG